MKGQNWVQGGVGRHWLVGSRMMTHRQSAARLVLAACAALAMAMVLHTGGTKSLLMSASTDPAAAHEAVAETNIDIQDAVGDALSDVADSRQRAGEYNDWDSDVTDARQRADDGNNWDGANEPDDVAEPDAVSDSEDIASVDAADAYFDAKDDEEGEFSDSTDVERRATGKTIMLHQQPRGRDTRFQPPPCCDAGARGRLWPFASFLGMLQTPCMK